MKKNSTVRLKALRKDIATTPVLAYHGYGTGRIFEDDLISQHIETCGNVSFTRNAKIQVPGSLIGSDYPYDSETIEVDALVLRKPKRASAVVRSGYEIKYQSCSGTAEDKIVASAYRLSLLIKANKLDRGFIVLGGNAWTPLPLYIAASIHPNVKLISEITFAKMAARGVL